MRVILGGNSKQPFLVQTRWYDRNNLQLSSERKWLFTISGWKGHPCFQVSLQISQTRLSTIFYFRFSFTGWCPDCENFLWQIRLVEKKFFFAGVLLCNVDLHWLALKALGHTQFLASPTTRNGLGTQKEFAEICQKHKNRQCVEVMSTRLNNAVTELHPPFCNCVFLFVPGDSLQNRRPIKNLLCNALNRLPWRKLPAITFWQSLLALFSLSLSLSLSLSCLTVCKPGWGQCGVAGDTPFCCKVPQPPGLAALPSHQGNKNTQDTPQHFWHKPRHGSRICWHRCIFFLFCSPHAFAPN